MKPIYTITAAATLLVAMAQAHGASLGDLKRTNLLRNDISAPGREAVQVLVEFEPGVTAAKHSHPGEEIVYVTKGSLEYRLEGKPPVVIKAGEALFIPSGTPHSVRNVGTDKAAELATYVVEKGKPLLAVKE
ncbi:MULTISPECIES: cupin domain-containing protein [unclassified Bradyrhizobium]|uniref:cupin domain-containing protein n=1 Tax=unclassified Bradyrhizobium TaxID=2631580 RepID=UPI001FF936C5|nr:MULTISPECIES: cupin domain-containing protein [unclassified Bradyrhizobium]MCK1537518.1 cupin domain-containing protein [Bradyrhizobium sp. 176]MCK1554906.1 cupin domain-containing protein [Bradyrhizobium sp. 171]UPJ28928.1 cupin domain-containing protein [Bradyrhizobium sp. CW1]